jgi:hypothetical protein
MLYQLGKRRRLIPIYKVQFVRSDLTTVWCELTRSVRTNSFLEDDSFGSFDVQKSLEKINNPRGIKHADETTTAEEEDDEEELLICIRPTYEGNNVGEECRFVPRVKAANESESMWLTDSKPASSSGNDISTNASSESKAGCSPPKKRFVREQVESEYVKFSPYKKQKLSSQDSTSTGRQNKINTAAESLLGLSHTRLPPKK